MKKSTKTQLNRFLKEMEKAELEKEVKKLYTKFKEVKEYYEMEFCDDTSKIVEAYKKQIENEYFPSRGYGKARNSESKKVITQFKKIAIFQKDVIELLLFRTEMMLEFTNQYGDMNDSFYNSLEGSFYEACKLISEERLEKHFKDECKKIIKLSSNFGWGLYYGLTESNDSFLGD